MNRQERRHRGERGPKEPRKPKLDAENVTLRDLRFETPDASEMLLNLRYLDDVFKGTGDNAVKLPPVDESVSTTPSSGGMVYKAFPHGLMYGDQMSLMGGIGVFGGVTMAVLGYVAWATGSIHMPGESFVAMLMATFLGLLFLFIIPLLLLIFIGDLVGYRFGSSTLFDRNACKVHVFSDQSISFKRGIPWHKRLWNSEIKTYDWRCIRAEIDTMSAFSGTIGRKEAGLRCVVYDRPGGDKVIDQFVLGVNMPAHHLQPLLDTWEHVRRFMQHEGPLFANEHDKPNKALGRQSLWQCLLMFPKLEMDTTDFAFKMAWEEKSIIALFFGFVGVILLPFLWLPALFGLFPWISGLAKREPKWPAEILASVGGNALRGAELEAWRGVVPGREESIANPIRTGLEAQ